MNNLPSSLQVKELGVLITNCSCLVDDVKKIFNVYWDMGKENAVIPPEWPQNYSTEINQLNPVPVNFNERFQMSTYFSVISATSVNSLQVLMLVLDFTELTAADESDWSNAGHRCDR